MQHLQQNGKPVPFEGQQAAIVTTKALEFLRARDRERPFFLFAGYVDTHSPFKDHPERLAQRYRKAQFSDIPNEKYVGPGRGIHLPPDTEAGRREALAQYYAAVSYVDEQLGILLDELEGRGELDDTLVVYTADHGHNNGHHGLYTKGNATVPQNFLEELIRVPCLLRLPGRIGARRSHAFPVDHLDLFQTLLEAAGASEAAEAKRKRNGPGRSYLPLLAAGASAVGWRGDQFCEYGNARMIRTGRHKLIVRYPPHAPRFSDELYDLAEDPRETTNRIADPAAAETVHALRARLEAHFAAYEIAEASGREILKRPVCNPNEPWRVPV